MDQFHLGQQILLPRLHEPLQRHLIDVMGCYWVRFSNTSLTTLPCLFTDNQYFLEHSRQPQRQPIRRLHW